MNRVLGIGALAGLVLLAGCRPHYEGRLTLPPQPVPQRQAPTTPVPIPPLDEDAIELPPGSPTRPEAPPEQDTPRRKEEQEPSLPGVYVIHAERFGVQGCVFLAQRATGQAGPPGSPEAQQARARAVLDLAEQTRWLGGNVVALPRFREGFRDGRLTGRIYRCSEPQRRDIYARAATAEQLTVIEQPAGAPAPAPEPRKAARMR